MTVDQNKIQFMTNSGRNEKEAFLAKAESLLSKGLYQTAQDLALEQLSRFPDDAEARVIVCHAWTRMGKLDNVKKMLREVDEAILGLSGIYARMGDICRQAGLNREAESFYRRYAAINPETPAAREITGKLASLLSSGEEATPPPEEDEGGESSPSSLQTVTLAELYIRQGHTDLALAVLEEVIKKDQTNHRAKAMLRQLRTEASLKTEKPSSGKADAVLRELTRWLNNISRLNNYAA
jgi:tetratricopeptide (TPR) repeat protein